MKKIVSSIILMCANSFGFSQTGINNLSFESWTSLAGPSPSGFIALGATQMTTGAQHLNSYVRLVSNGFPASHPSTSGAMQLGSFVGTNPVDGAPYILKPTNLTGYYKSSLVGNDTAYIAIDLTKNGVSILLPSSSVKKITSSTNTWTFFSINLSYSGNIVPDSIHIYVAANQSFAGVAPGQSGTTLDVDNFALVMNATDIFEGEILAGRVYVNPLEETLIIESKTEGTLKVEVYNLQGKLIVSENMEVQKSEISVSNYDPGLYLFRLTDVKNNTLKTGKFTITR
jgi:hypothetical protein